MIRQALYGVYDLSDHERCLGVYTLKEVLKRFNLTVNTLWVCTKYHKPVLNRYDIVRLKEEC